MRKNLADTGPLYAALDPDDQYHEQAQAEYNQFEIELKSSRLPSLFRFQSI